MLSGYLKKIMKKHVNNMIIMIMMMIIIIMIMMMTMMVTINSDATHIPSKSVQQMLKCNNSEDLSFAK